MSSRRAMPAARAGRHSASAAPHAPSASLAASGPALRPLALALHLALAGSLATAAGWPAEAGAQQPAARTVVPAKAYDIPAGPLAGALNRFAEESGVLLTAQGTATQGKRSPGLKGSYTVQGGFAALLAGSGLQAFRQDDGSYGLRPVPVDKRGETTLAPVTVTDRAGLGSLTEGTGAYTTGSTSAATGMNLKLRETPQSVSVITRQRIEDQNLASMDDIMQQTVGVSTVQTGMANGTYIRGYQVSNFQVDGVSTTFQSFGTQSNMGFGSMDSAVYDSVAVVRGAAGLLTGAGDPSGSVSLIRKRPTRAFQASVEGSAGRWDQYRAVGDVGGSLNAAGTLRGRFVGAYSEGKSWIDNYRGDKNVAYGIFEADLGGRTLLSLTLERVQESTKGASGNYGNALPVVYSDGSLTLFDRHSNKLPAWASWDSERNTVALSLEHAFNDDWRVQLNYRHDDIDDWHKTLEAYGSFNQSNIFPAPDGWINYFGYEGKTESFSATLNGRYDLFGRQHELVAGFNGSSSEHQTKQKQVAESPWVFAGLPIIDGVAVYPEPDWHDTPTTRRKPSETKQSGFYLATRFHATERLSAIIGGRWSDWDYEDKNRDEHRKFSGVFVPYAGVIYDLSDRISAYASYTEIFQPQSARDVKGSLLDPEEGKNREIGLKGEWFGGRLNASIAAFETRKDNLAVYDWGTTNPVTGDVVARAEDGTKGRGWELEVSGEPAPGWQLQGGYTRFVLRDGKDQRMNTDTLPEHLFKLFTAYTPQNLPRLTLGGGINWQSKVYRSTAQGRLRDIYTQESYAVANLMASYRFDDRLSLNVNLNNVFDKEYRTRVHLHMYGPERNLSASLKYQF